MVKVKSESEKEVPSANWMRPLHVVGSGLLHAGDVEGEGGARGSRGRAESRCRGRRRW